MVTHGARTSWTCGVPASPAVQTGRWQGNPRAAFTLSELTIVIFLLALLGMIVVPKVIDAADEARESALGTDLQAARRQIERYILEHADRAPHLNESGSLDTGGLVDRMTKRTQQDGKLDTAGPCGPYLPQWPSNPFSQESVAQKITFGQSKQPPRNAATGWYYCIPTHILYANSTRGGDAFDSAGQVQAEPIP